MWTSILKTCAATVLFAAVHSGLASGSSKAAARVLFGPSNADGVYRVLYIAQSFMTTGLLVAYVRRQPSVEIYRVRGPLAWAMHAAQTAALLHATAAAQQVGILRVTGLANLGAWLKGEEVPTMPEAQGPALDSNSVARAAGPFAWSRHPLNLSPVPVFWLWPRMTTTLLAFNVTSTCYLILGSVHEEQRLSEVDGAKYEAYREGGVSFFWPTRVISPSRNLLQLLNSSSTDDS
jgi:protein-S-isoprenylcysteine O-methyltransferase Ste14